MKALVAFDDLDAASGKRTLADTTVRYEIELDLTTEHAQELAEILKPYLDARKAAAASAVQRPARPKASSTTILPEVEPYLPPTGSRERRDYLRDLRKWADEHGRSGEYATSYGDTTYGYPLALVQDYVKYLEENGGLGGS